MHWTAFTDALLSTQIPWLPDPMLMRWGRRLSWGIVLVGLALWLGRRWPRRVQFGLSVMLMVWSLWPGAVSPAFWLGLAFQSPSLMTTMICLVWVGVRLSPGASDLLNHDQVRKLRLAGLASIALGWLLLLDTFAQLPISLYAIGFSPAVVAVAALVASLPWVVFGSPHPARGVSMLLGAVLLLYVLLRLPSGNLWDALLDPWLWVALQMDWLLRGARRLNALWRGQQATRV
jgi:hypothetical protein